MFVNVSASYIYCILRKYGSHKKNEFNEMTMNLYVEAEYKVDECIYVQVTLCESGKICNVGNKEKAFLSNR